MRQIWQMQLTRVWDILHDECSHSQCRTVATVIHIPSGQYTTYKRLSTGTYAIGNPVQIGLENIPLKWMHEIMCRPHLNYERGTKTREVTILPSASRDMFLWKHRLHISSITWDINIITKDTVRNLNQRKWKRYCVCKLQRTRKQKRDFLLGMMIYRAMWRRCSHMLTTMHTQLQIHTEQKLQKQNA